MAASVTLETLSNLDIELADTLQDEWDKLNAMLEEVAWPHISAYQPWKDALYAKRDMAMQFKQRLRETHWGDNNSRW